jgi:hypothetical protein
VLQRGSPTGYDALMSNPAANVALIASQSLRGLPEAAPEKCREREADDVVASLLKE